MSLSFYTTGPHVTRAYRTMSYFDHPPGAVLTQPECWTWAREQPVAYLMEDYECGASFDSYFGYNTSILRRVLGGLIIMSEYTAHLDRIPKITMSVTSYGNGPYAIPAWRMWWGYGLNWIGPDSPRGWGTKSVPAGPVQPELVADHPTLPITAEDQTAHYEFDLTNLDHIERLAEPYPDEDSPDWKVPFFIALEDECYDRIPAFHVDGFSDRETHLQDTRFWPRTSARVYYRSGTTITPLAPGAMSGRTGRGGPGVR